jgi:predicted dehydrogenase
MPRSNRRTFLTTSAAAAGASMVAAPAIAASRLSPNDRIRVGMVGLGGRMHSHMAAVAQMAGDNVEIAAISDCDQTRLDAAGKNYPQIADKKLVKYSDQRKLFDDRSIDAVSFATPDHWHALQTIWACQAGKHVYVEKPGTHNLFEGRQMVAAARKYERMVQHGTQNRSSPNIREGIRQLHEGLIGDLYMARGIDFKIRGNLGTNTPSPVPPGLDWDAWVGPAPMKPYSQFRHRRWYWVFDFASGCFANQAVHELDIIRWGLGLDDHPTKIQALGGKYVHQDDRDSPTHVAWAYEFQGPKPLVTYEHRSWYTSSEAGFRDTYPFVQPDFPVGTIFFGSEGYLIFPDYTSYYSFLGPKREPGPSASDPGHEMADLPHFQNWVAAIRSRNHEDLTADIEEGHKSMAFCLLAKAAYQLGRSLRFDPATETCPGDDEANELLAPKYREPYVVPKDV